MLPGRRGGVRWGGRGCRSSPYARRPSRQGPGWARGPRERRADRDAAARRDHHQAPARATRLRTRPARTRLRPRSRPGPAPAQVLGGPARAPVPGQARVRVSGGELGPGRAGDCGRDRAGAVGWPVGGWHDRWGGRDGLLARLLLGNASSGIATRRYARLAAGGSSGVPSAHQGASSGGWEAGSRPGSSGSGRSSRPRGWFGSPGVVTSASPDGLNAGYFTFSRKPPSKPSTR